MNFPFLDARLETISWTYCFSLHTGAKTQSFWCDELPDEYSNSQKSDIMQEAATTDVW